MNHGLKAQSTNIEENNEYLHEYRINRRISEKFAVLSLTKLFAK